MRFARTSSTSAHSPRARGRVYRSRDYRFLGSIGWSDTVVLPLDEGDNDLVVAVAEDFGGWGIQGRFTDAAGITFGSGP